MIATDIRDFLMEQLYENLYGSLGVDVFSADPSDCIGNDILDIELDDGSGFEIIVSQTK